MKKILRWGIFLSFILSGCLAMPDAIRDVRELRQDHAAYFTGAAESKEPLTLESQARMDEDYNIIYFSVWHQIAPFHALPDRVRQDFQKFAVKPGYGENKKLHPPSWLKKLERNAALKNYPNALTRGITIRNTNLRILPTQAPHFYSSDGDSSAWPFDNLQRSSVPANTPVYVCHLSADQAWALVETSFTFGWIPADDLASVDDGFIRTWESGRYAVILRDQTSVLDNEGRFLVHSGVGHVFPLAEPSADKVQMLIAVADKNRQAVIRRGFVPLEAAAVKPLRFNRLTRQK